MDRREVTWLVSFTVIVVILITWLASIMNAWEDKCHEIGGIVESRYLYTQTTTINNVTTSTDIYSYHCMVNGNEVEV